MSANSTTRIATTTNGLESAFANFRSAGFFTTNFEKGDFGDTFSVLAASAFIGSDFSNRAIRPRKQLNMPT